MLRALTYNILSDRFSSYHAHYCPPKYLEWAYRLPRILQIVLRSQADLICLQEVDELVWRDSIQPFFAKHSYQGRLCCKGPAVDDDWGPALLYNTAKLDCIAATSIRFCDAASSWMPQHLRQHAADTPVIQQLLSLQDGFVMALLRVKGPLENPAAPDAQHAAGSAASPQPAIAQERNFPFSSASRSLEPTTAANEQSAGQQVICAVSVHLFWNPNYPDIKAMQAAILCQQVQQFLEQHNAAHAAVLCGGDFNSLWQKYEADPFDPDMKPGEIRTSGVYKLLTEGCLDPAHHDHPVVKRGFPAAMEWPLHSHGLGLQSMHMAVHGHEPAFTNHTQAFSGCLDYLFFTPGALQPMRTMPLPYQAPPRTPPSKDTFPLMPNQEQPSDHLPVGGDFKLLHC